MESFFVWLGSGRAKRRGVGETGIWLDRATQAGLPVLNGAVLLHEFFHLAQQEEVVYWENGRISIPAPSQLHHLLYQQVRFPKLDNPVTLSPILSTTPPTPLPYTATPFTRADQLAAALKTAWEQAITPPTTTRYDLLILEYVEPHTQGTAKTAAAQNADSLETADSTLSLPQLSPWSFSASPHLPPFAQRLQKLLRGIRRTFPGPWWVQWIDDGRICWLVQLHPIKSGPNPSSLLR